ncbi:MAG: UDP-N-acetylglucosamine 4,6-dehydratase (inverting) [Acidimicrobiia bacterium]|nr:UDP-N-acetylglucosamine 4,6-dehydratase (inverting) [Acidimicrobiia bacterium]
MLNGKNILITGGTGSFGKRFAATALTRFSPSKVIIYSRDELKQFEMQHLEPFSSHDSTLRWFIGDVRDEKRLRKALEGVDVVVHAAAMKQVPAAEYNPFEAVKTNILGAENVINASMDNGVQRVIALSTDKAAAPINLYGTTKLASDKLFIAANNHRGNRDIRFAAVRYGNVMGSRGSVIPFFIEKAKTGVLPITDPEMTRFNITLQQGVDFVIDCLERMWGGELFVPKIPSYRILDVAEAVDPDARIEIVGIRPGEKVHEDLITRTDSLSTVEFDDYYVIKPSYRQWDEEEFRLTSSTSPGTPTEPGFHYSSDANKVFLTVEQLRDLIATEIG